jgi:hypothetical protein
LRTESVKRSPTGDEHLLNDVRAVLFLEWDPIGVNGNESCRNEYDSYARTIIDYLHQGKDEHKLTVYLAELQRNSMGLSVINEERDRRVARSLLRLVR